MATKSFGVWLTFAIFTLNMIVQNVVGDITYEPGWVIPYPGIVDDRAIYLVSDVSQYEVTALNYDGENVSDGQCETLLSEGHYSGPCLTNITAHNQIFSVECFQNASNTATVTFFATNGSATDQEAQIVTAGNVWGGFTNEEINSPLRQSTTEPIVGKGDRISAVFSCYNDNRGGIGVSNTTTSSS